MRNSGGSLLDTAVAPPPAGHLRLQATGPGGWEGPQSLCPYYTDGETEARGAKAPVQCHPAKAGLGPEFGGSQAWPVSAHLRVRGKLAWKEHREGEGRSPEPLGPSKCPLCLSQNVASSQTALSLSVSVV